MTLKCRGCNKKLTGRQKVWCSRKCKDTDNNTKYQVYQHQKRRSTERKIAAVKAKGGCCQKCGYKDNLSALTFHHRDPSEKEFTLDSRNLANLSEERRTRELEKCDLLCIRCHTEHHNPDMNNLL
jgi:hypothetical protein